MEKSNEPVIGFYTTFRGEEVYARLSHLINHHCAFKIFTEDDTLLEMLSMDLPKFANDLGPDEFFAQIKGENKDFARDALASGMFEDTGRTSPDKRRIPIWRQVD